MPKSFFNSTIWLLLVMAGLATLYFLEQQKLTPPAPEFPNEAQVVLIDQFLRDNSGIPYTNKEHGTIYLFPDGTYERAESLTRMNDGSPQLTPKQSQAVGELSTLTAPAWMVGDRRVITVKDYNHFILNLQAMLWFGALAGLLIGAVVGICRGDWFVPVFLSLVFVVFAGLGVLWYRPLLIVFAIATIVIIPFSYLGFYPRTRTPKYRV